MMAGLLGGGAGFLGIAPAVMEDAPPDRGGIASGVFTAAGQSGGVLGVALLGTLVSTWSGFTGGLHLGILLAALAFFTGAAVTVTGVRRLGHEPANAAAPADQE
ncbi:MAG: hypothetical protein ABJB47_15600 [Actinomycetota bacterium]